MVKLTLEAAEGGVVRSQVVAMQRRPVNQDRRTERHRAAHSGPDRSFFSPCLHCGRKVHVCRKECSTCGRPNRWHVHRRRVVRLGLTVGEGGSVRVGLLCCSSAHASAEAAAGGEADEVCAEGKEEEDEPCTWVMCDNCEKWRRLQASSAEAMRCEELPEQWRCEMNEDVRGGT